MPPAALLYAGKPQGNTLDDDALWTQGAEEHKQPELPSFTAGTACPLILAERDPPLHPALKYPIFTPVTMFPAGTGLTKVEVLHAAVLPQ